MYTCPTNSVELGLLPSCPIYSLYITYRIYKHHIIWINMTSLVRRNWPIDLAKSNDHVIIFGWIVGRLSGSDSKDSWAKTTNMFELSFSHRILLSSFQTLHAVPVEWIKINSNVFLFHYCDLIVFVYFECFKGIFNLPARWNMVEDREFMRSLNSSMAMYGLNLYTVYVFYYFINWIQSADMCRYDIRSHTLIV